MRVSYAYFVARPSSLVPRPSVRVVESPAATLRFGSAARKVDVSRRESVWICRFAAPA